MIDEMHEISKKANKEDNNQKLINVLSYIYIYIYSYNSEIPIFIIQV